ncbi:RagB/SusD family nutrient uptake outer membrane protein [Haoranjiania flava]|uniref:RagB/SusD family nutrient uptake outer membrane protein n=1 Tax=Haoranjiania flava TaxID=1856322 RepID=A0AAE3ILA0_9BACT|nr:RagB/SusD family nutrient uptake outer membrane protein [Haoranjiania flava]MCU7693021.1 RagB/SusD family nutrient uptake outer membrane protein [Haoranjiania flava]
MKVTIIFITGILSLLSYSCNKLDLPPMNIIQDKDVFSTESGITAYLSRLYYDLPIENFSATKDGFRRLSWPTSGNCSGEMLIVQNDMLYDSPSGDWFQNWNYGAVRNVNYFIGEFPKYKNNYTQAQADQWLGEAYFIRGYYYFAMVKRYGGVPIIKTPQYYPQQSLEELKVPRNTEKEVYDFIIEDLDQAIKLLPEKSIAKGRVNRYVAYALKSRACLYAGSIAQYGAMQLNNILGIPKEQAEIYFKASYESAKALENSYSLYRKFPDKFENYWNLFLDENSPETIFAEYFIYPEKTHSFDLHNIPYQMRGAPGYSSRLNPTLDLVEMFDDINGNSGTLDIGPENDPKRFSNTMDVFVNVEPRLRGSVILPGDIFKGEAIEIQKGLYTSFPSGELKTSADFNALYNGKNIIGKSGMGHPETTITGFLVRKYQNPKMERSQVLGSRSTQAWIDMRYAEVLLNRAEAAFQIGLIDDALKCINEIRDRAGAKLYTKDQLTEKSIQKERRMELAFENHSYWDLRRWRIADKEINNRQYKALSPYYIFNEKKFIFKKEYVGGKYTFYPKVNYAKIPEGEIAKNENLQQNPGY